MHDYVLHDLSSVSKSRLLDFALCSSSLECALPDFSNSQSLVIDHDNMVSSQDTLSGNPCSFSNFFVKAHWSLVILDSLIISPFAFQLLCALMYSCGAICFYTILTILFVNFWSLVGLLDVVARLSPSFFVLLYDDRNAAVRSRVAVPKSATADRPTPFVSKQIFWCKLFKNWTLDGFCRCRI